MPDNLDISLAYIDYYQKMNKLKSALSEGKRFLKLQPDNILILNKLAKIYMKSDQSIAWDYAKRAYDISSDSPDILNTYGSICIEKERYVEGLDVLKKAVAAAPENSAYQYQLAQGFYLSGKSDFAKELLRTTLTNKNPFSERNKAEKLLAELDKGFFD